MHALDHVLHGLHELLCVYETPVLLELLCQIELMSLPTISSVDRVELGQPSLGVQPVRCLDVAFAVGIDVAIMLSAGDAGSRVGAQFALNVTLNNTVVVVFGFVLKGTLHDTY